MTFHGPANEYLILSEITQSDGNVLRHKIEHGLTIIWNKGSDATFRIDHITYPIKQDQVCFLTEFHNAEPVTFDELRIIRFNSGFYCILDHDSEVGCKGTLFFGAAQVPLITVKNEEADKFETLWKMFKIEMESKDNLQIEMLQMMLKRLLILSTRIYKQQNTILDTPANRMELLKMFNYLVESHFKEHHDVAFYASQLNKTPKSISNLFLANGNKSPLVIIQDRIMLEARRLLQKTSMPVKEISYILGYEDIQTFSRFFKSKEKISPIAYRQQTKDLIHSTQGKEYSK